jgi:iron(II)-dependent oxidoreductase
MTIDVTAMHSVGRRARHYFRDELHHAIPLARKRLHSLIDDLSDAQWQVSPQSGLDPVAWTTLHIVWFWDFWVLRGADRQDAAGAVTQCGPLHVADECFDAEQVSPEARWNVPLPPRAQLMATLDTALQLVLDALARATEDDASLNPFRLAMLHEDLHNEALAGLRATLGYPAPLAASLREVPPSVTLSIPPEAIRIGWPADAGGFAFDNERPEHEVAHAAFEIDSAVVTAGEFRRFVEAGGYRISDYWTSDEARRWRALQRLDHPRFWRRSALGWEQRWFDQWLPVDPQQPIMHVSAFEAEAYCNWAERRLPHASEWEHAANEGRLDWGGSVWEWTADAFAPYSGFVAGPFSGRSPQRFPSGRELRGGSFATHARLHHVRFRHVASPDRTDLFTGFRTAATPRSGA